ncbi:MAG TPA: DUF4153 domain-containing protein [Allosphingosinicella sp.]
MNERTGSEHPAWPLRALLLAGLGAAFGLLFDSLIGGSRGSTWPDSPLRIAGAAFLAVSGLVFALTLERRRWTWSAAFAAACGLVAAFVAGWNGSPNGWGPGEGWQFFSGLLAVAIAVPLFQSSRDGGDGGRRPDTALVHAHVWTNLVLGAAACTFVGATILLTVLLAQLFHLIGIDFLRDLMNESGFMWTLACGAFGGAVGLLRDRDQVLATLHKVGRAVLSVLAPVLALGLALFVLALPFTGLQPLWEQTEATPIMLVCIVGAVLLVNAAIGNSADEEARSPPVRYAALALVPVMLPLAFVAAISTAKRIDQYGLTPDRLWACVFVLAAAAFALAYLYAVVRGRAAWPEALRRANVRVAAGLCLLALFLALPIVSFGALSARDQLARLQSGSVTPDRFDWAAMRFDFGPAGRRALERLAASSDLVIRQRARQALRASSRWAIGAGEPPPPAPPIAVRTPRVQNRPEGGADITPALKDIIDRTGQCSERPCRVVFLEPRQAIVLRPDCADCRIYMFEGRPGGTWEQKSPPVPIASASRPRFDTAKGRVEVRRVERRQLFVDGQPVGEAFE